MMRHAAHADGRDPQTVGESERTMSERKAKKLKPLTKEETEPDWSGKCIYCGQSPVVPITGLCGPCTFGSADAAGGNW